ncbi:sulfatase family protein [Pseudolysinimonas sp.]|uniref:sulfatase family protein n=1 Tax=Pseudolysinimonas sp. TaxID=2680009 RepID=UPI003F7ED354
MTAPDIVLIVTDQHRADASRRAGFPLDTTPFLDALAADGVWFDRAYTTAPLCSPARTSLLTGRWPSAHRVTQNPARELAVFGTDLVEVAHDAGYATALIGKNHTYLTPDRVDAFVEYSHDGREPAATEGEEAAFDAWLGGLRHRTPSEAAPFPVELQNPHRIVDDALAWVGRQPGDRPMLLIVSFPEPHNPYQVPEPYFSMFPPETLPPTLAGPEVLGELPFAYRYLHEIGEDAYPDYDAEVARARSSYYGMLRLIDDEVRRLVDGLAPRHAERPRIVVATADHGDYAGDYGLVRKGAEIGDVLARIPLIVQGDDVRQMPEGAHPAHVSLADLMPTLCEAIGTPIPAGVQGRSIWPLLTGAPYPRSEFDSAYVEQGMGGLPYGPDDVPSPQPGLLDDAPDGSLRFDELNAVTQSGRRRKIRMGDWTLDVDLTGGPRLHHLPSDPLELVDRWDDPDAAEARVALLARLAVWQMRAEDPLPPVPTGYPQKTDPRNYVAPAPAPKEDPHDG